MYYQRMTLTKEDIKNGLRPLENPANGSQNNVGLTKER